MAGLKETELREPTEDEMALLNFMLKGLPPEFDAYNRQLEGLKVRYDCDCGCPTIELTPRKDAPSGPHQEIVIPDGKVFYDDGSPCWLIVFVKDGRLFSLEIAPMAQSPANGASVARVEYSSEAARFPGRVVAQ
jgi:hypothetical protein